MSRRDQVLRTEWVAHDPFKARDASVLSQACPSTDHFLSIVKAICSAHAVPGAGSICRACELRGLHGGNVLGSDLRTRGN